MYQNDGNTERGQCYNCILQQMLLFPCIGVSESGRVPRRPSLMDRSDIFLLPADILVLSERIKLTDSKAQKDKDKRQRRCDARGVMFHAIEKREYSSVAKSVA